MKFKSINTKNKSSPEEIENSVIDVSDMYQSFEGHLDPKFYIHVGLLRAQQSLLNENANAGMISYRHMIENLWIIGKSFNLIDRDARIELSDEEKRLSVDAQSMVIANAKLQHLLENVFSSAPIQAPVMDRDDGVDPPDKPAPITDDVEVGDSPNAGDTKIEGEEEEPMPVLKSPYEIAQMPKNDDLKG